MLTCKVNRVVRIHSANFCMEYRLVESYKVYVHACAVDIYIGIHTHTPKVTRTYVYARNTHTHTHTRATHMHTYGIQTCILTRTLTLT